MKIVNFYSFKSCCILNRLVNVITYMYTNFVYFQLTRRVYKGIPDRIRGEIWSRLLGVHIVKMEQDGVYNVSYFL